MGTTYGFRRCLGEAKVKHFALGDQSGDRLRRLLDRRLLVDTVLVVKVDVVRAETLERALDGKANIRSTTVDDSWATTGMGDEPKLRRDDYLFATAFDGLTYDLFAMKGSVDFGGVDVGYPEV